MILSILIVLTISAAACSPKPNTVEQLPVVESDLLTTDPEPEQSISEEPQQAEVSFPVWYSTPLTDVNTGAVFTVEESLGKVILVETLATWCSNCFRQQNEVASLHDLIKEVTLSVWE